MLEKNLEKLCYEKENLGESEIKYSKWMEKIFRNQKKQNQGSKEK